MRDTSPFIRRTGAGVITLLLATALAVVAPVRAQSVDDAETTESQDSTDAAAESKGEEPAPTGDGVVLSPFDYEASESISEDASVSFPVDI